ATIRLDASTGQKNQWLPARERRGTLVCMRFAAPMCLGMLVVSAGVGAQQPDGKPTNSAPNPYQTIEGWAKLPDGRGWGALSAVDVDRDGVSLWVAERCGANSCADSKLPPVMKFDSTGKVVRAFGAGLMISPHGIYVDRDDNV